MSGFLMLYNFTFLLDQIILYLKLAAFISFSIMNLEYYQLLIRNPIA